MADRTCSVADCALPHVAKGLCRRHYDARRAGRPFNPDFRQRRYLGLPRTDDLALALVMRVEEDEHGCWIWQGSTQPSGYGSWKWGNRGRPAHRWFWETFVGPIPEGMEVDHLCRNRACQNVDHMEVVTRAENLRRAKPYLPRGEDNHNGAKTHCPQGHAYDEVNTYYWRGHRYCRICTKAAARKCREKQVA